MGIINIIATFSSVFVLNHYLMVNIESLGGGSLGLEWLGTFFGIVSFVVLLQMASFGAPVILRSAFVLSAFLLLFFFRLVVDFWSAEALGKFLIGTTGGVVLFYLAGSFVGIGINAARSFSVTHLLGFRIYTFLLMLYGGYLIFSIERIFAAVVPHLRADIILIGGLDGDYQRTGDFLIISYILSAVVFINWLTLFARQNLGKSSPYPFMASCLFILITSAFLFITQLFGSNKGTATISLISASFFCVYFLFTRRYIKRELSCREFSLRRVVSGRLGFEILWSLFCGVLFLALFGIGLAFILGIDLSKTRMFGFGSGHNSSLESRILLFRYFFVMLDYSPIFGNMNVDCLTVGCGKYVHSLFASLLTHTGVVGFLIFSSYIVIGYRERKTIIGPLHERSYITSNFENLCYLMIFGAVLLVGGVGVFFTWPALWFGAGLLIPAFRFRVASRQRESVGA